VRQMKLAASLGRKSLFRTCPWFRRQARCMLDRSGVTLDRGSYVCIVSPWVAAVTAGC
jgi:hypothetical protein